MKEISKLIIVLTVICAVSSALLAAVYQCTEKPIAESLKRRTAKAAAAVLPTDAESVAEKSVDGVTYFEATKAGKVIGRAFKGHSDKGYGGPVELMVGLGTDGKLISFEVIKATETPGLGTKMSSDNFRKPLFGRDYKKTNWSVTKDGGDVTPITAATISSRAACACIRDAIEQAGKIEK